ncbi:MAG: BatD family protein [Immundisolibacterales bacterium]|nr:BatD family protein [Immundisolibacterales bacterium]
MTFVRPAVLAAAVLAAAVLAPALASAATVSLSADSPSIHAGMPFTLTLTAKGFAEDPPPAAPELAIDGATVTFLGVSPNVSTRITVINGRTTEERDVTFLYRWRVNAPAEGSYQVPALEIAQEGRSARTSAASFEATAVPDTPDMIVRMDLPEDGVYVGETFDAEVEWLLARNVETFEFVVPLFDLEGAVVEAAPGTGRTVRFAAGASDVELPMHRGEEVIRDRTLTRFRFPARITLARSGSFELAPVRVVARLQTGETRDRLGFRRPQYRLYRAEGRARRLAVRPLPIAGRPASFVNAIGGGFSIDVQASRTVVSLGDPVELTVRVRGDGTLEGLTLPPLAGPGGLPPGQFSVPDGDVTGRIDTETNGKVFTVTVRVTSAEAKEIPPLAFSWFDPSAGEYRTARSRPVALSVDAAAIVGAGDVVAAPALAAAADRRPLDVPASGAPAGIATLIGADMSLSDPRETLARPWGAGDLRIVLGLLYAVPGLLVLIAWWLARTGRQRARQREIRAAFREVERALASAAPAREAAPAIVAAVRRLAGLHGADRAAANAALERLETRAFDPAAAGDPIEGDLIDEVRAVVRTWAREAPRPAASTAAVLVVLGGAAAGVVAMATAATPGTELAEARARYAEALSQTDRERRVRLFGAAEQAFRPFAAANPDAARVQADWGNAALGAQDAGRAVLAYRRALRAMPNDARSRTNLAWLRDRMPAWLPHPPTGGSALDSLLFWQGLLNPAQLHLVAAGAFALALLALAGRFLGRRRGLAILVAPALAVWAGAIASAFGSRPHPGEAVVVADDTTLRSADSAGAAPALARELPAGAEVIILESRGAWSRVRLADGSSGWLAAGTVQRVAANPP